MEGHKTDVTGARGTVVACRRETHAATYGTFGTSSVTIHRPRLFPAVLLPMRHRRRATALVSSLLALVACAPPAAPRAPAPDRVLAVDADGRVIRRSGFDENARSTFAAPVDRVWPALVLSYADLGIEPSVADRALGLYGNGSFVAPRRLAGRPLGDFFDCGAGMTGPYIQSGRLTANVITTLRGLADGTTVASTSATGTLQRNDGASGDPIVCASTGRLEEALRKGVESRLATTR